MTITKIKLPFGQNINGTLAHIADVGNGKKCGCICPSCQAPLIAAKGNKKQHHFKHAVDKKCEGGLESAIHLAAKQIIKEKKEITLSQYDLTVSKIDSKGKKHTVNVTITQHGTVTRFDSVCEEVELHGMRADILTTTGNEQLIIEVFYRHKVEEQKIEKIKKANISAVEINLSNLMPEDLNDLEAFWSYINDPQYVQWLHNAQVTDYNLKLEALLEEKIQEEENKYKKEAIEKQKQQYWAPKKVSRGNFRF